MPLEMGLGAVRSFRKRREETRLERKEDKEKEEARKEEERRYEFDKRMRLNADVRAFASEARTSASWLREQGLWDEEDQARLEELEQQSWRRETERERDPEKWAAETAGWERAKQEWQQRYDINAAAEGRAVKGEERTVEQFGVEQAEREATAERRPELESREDERYRQELEDRKQRLEAEAGKKFLDAIKSGMPIMNAVAIYNSAGETQIIPESMEYDPASGRIKFTETDGDTFDGTVEQMEAAIVGLEDELKTVSAGQHIVRIPGGGGEAEQVYAAPFKPGDGDGGEKGAMPSADRLYYKDIGNELAREMGGQFSGITGEIMWTEGRPELYTPRLRIGQYIARQIVEGRIPVKFAPGEIASMVMEATHDLKSQTDLQAEVEKAASAKTNLFLTEAAEFGGGTKDQWIAGEVQKRRAEQVAKTHHKLQKILDKAMSQHANLNRKSMSKENKEAAESYLRAHPESAEQFEQTFGYLPDWARK